MNEKDYLYDLLVHDLVGPLAVVATTVNSLLGKTERYGDLSLPQRESLERIRRNTQKARGLVQDILEVARSEENLFHSERFAVQELLKEALLEGLESTNPAAGDELAKAGSDAEVAAVLARYSISLSVSGRYAGAPFYHDRKKVMHIVRNLVSNALKYRREKMSLAVSGDAELVVEVSNDGSAISEQDREAVYKRFVRLETNNVKDVPGLGLGLFCTKALVEKMRGEITVASREGFSTCFTVRIPFSELTEEEGIS
jgi:two-component system, OmpR family, sensor histidine kinase CiaH